MTEVMDSQSNSLSSIFIATYVPTNFSFNADSPDPSNLGIKVS